MLAIGAARESGDLEERWFPTVFARGRTSPSAIEAWGLESTGWSGTRSVCATGYLDFMINHDGEDDGTQETLDILAEESQDSANDDGPTSDDEDH